MAPRRYRDTFLYSGDLLLPGMLWGKVLRSPFPHARIVHIDTSGASSLPGVHAVLTGRDLAGMLVGRTLRDMPLLAQENVRFRGRESGRRRRGRCGHGRRGPHPHRGGV